ncbi:hypothetical protein AMJ85_09000 [candidate division BRC1 bacterium SM23_51]|nr:MAG: hypothetical protein AMJ85_09000 [candidate division BRC1 bacterium SM23_51]
MILQRALWAALMLGLFLVSVLFERLHWLVTVLAIVFGALCLVEIGKLIRARSLRFPYPLCFVFALLLVADGQVAGLSDGLHILTGFVVVALTYRVLRSDYKNLAAEVGANLLATAYIGLPMAMAVAMMQMVDEAGSPIGKYHLLFQVLVVFTGDSAAYFVGRSWGKRPFFPRLSPMKKAEGAAASVIVSVAVALVLIIVFGPIRQFYGVGHGLLLGLLLGAAAPLGDLAESAFKRDAGQKDSASYLKGHGGFLDVFDAVLFGLPVQFCYIQLVLAQP